MLERKFQRDAAPIVGLVDAALHAVRDFAVMMIGEHQEGQRARAFFFRQRSIVARQFERRRHPRIVIGRTLKIIVGMNLQVDFLGRNARQRGDRVFDRHIGQRRNVQMQRHRDLLALAESVAQREALVLADGDMRDFRQGVFGLIHAVARHRDDIDHHRRTEALRA